MPSKSENLPMVLIFTVSILQQLQSHPVFTAQTIQIPGFSARTPFGVSWDHIYRVASVIIGRICHYRTRNNKSSEKESTQIPALRLKVDFVMVCVKHNQSRARLLGFTQYSMTLSDGQL